MPKNSGYRTKIASERTTSTKTTSILVILVNIVTNQPIEFDNRK